MYIRMVALAKKMANLVDWRDPEQMLKGPLTCLNYFWYVVEHEKL